MGTYVGRGYERVSDDGDLESIDLKDREYDCVLVFDCGKDEEWTPPKDPRRLDYDYLELLDQTDRDRRKARFPAHGADMVAKKALVRDFYTNERLLILKVLGKLEILHKQIDSMKPENHENKVFYYIGVLESLVFFCFFFFKSTKIFLGK
ncbi:hypothetical protein RFI_11447 [Reticulomyxa filosa]|uniref:Uncharacterized protein n=1 Tax=Reticulomyxa filosa TaxID=46433 RepID=X6NIX0_RETFI|nr:hypothetical protein RFI_11447 [Reticulomyxa filosa]|eukprot:ETO25689.1 hypothetical protein RFI_11447 [Reticulomyxa filosa]